MPLPDLTRRLWSPRAERLVLCGLLRAPDLVAPRVAAVLRPDDLYHWAHRVAYRRLLELYEAADPGPLDLYWRLRLTGELADFGGAARFAAWAAGVLAEDPTGYWAVQAAERVRWLARRRAVVRAAELAIRDAVDGVYGPDEYERLAVGLAAAGD